MYGHPLHGGALGTRKSVCQLLTSARRKIEEAAEVASDRGESEHLARLTVEHTSRTVGEIIGDAWSQLEARLDRAHDDHRRQFLTRIFHKRVANLRRDVAADHRLRRFPEARETLLDSLTSRWMEDDRPLDNANLDLVEV